MLEMEFNFWILDVGECGYFFICLVLMGFICWVFVALMLLCLCSNGLFVVQGFMFFFCATFLFLNWVATDVLSRERLMVTQVLGFFILYYKLIFMVLISVWDLILMDAKHSHHHYIFFKSLLYFF